MKKAHAGIVGCILAAALWGCSTVPITGRKQLKLVPEAQMISESAASYGEVVAQGPLSTNKQQTEQVRRVGQRISAAVEQYFRDRGQSELLAGFSWEFNLIDEDVPNAWCMPGGKVAFYTGILPYTQNDAGIAVVMGHEIAHAVAGHGTERVSHQLLQQGGSYVAAYLSQESEYRDAIMQAYGLTTQMGGILPYSRLHESEADQMGLVFMAMAGYNPEAAIGFWQRMSAGNPDAPPEFLSTHPSDEKRIRKLRQFMPEAMQYYRP
ncbi:M48 family metallopeptidase [Pontiella sulfatireligans]|uniref:Beta-barrel assembly-enhancing protease n=1 Tax=Pontiella sulfatireligans TaxID=2750658 RepID=A0A6C2UNV1_9BACT|nr:M48 family metallopeptidase [Pontiella sulfatireligans]VGO20726.1 Beta-barrel assembly-enhancing protease [Pontiella sulfatireligans]